MAGSAAAHGLPTELQIKIWHYTLPAPRIIQLHNLNGSFSFRGACPPPALHTCQLSREVALSVLEPTFTRNNELLPVYIDLAHDVDFNDSWEITGSSTFAFLKENIRGF